MQIIPQRIRTTIVAIVILLILNIKTIIKFINELGIVLLATGGFVTIIDLIINSKVKIENIKILNDAFSEVIVKTITEILNNITTYGIIAIITGIAVTIITNIIISIKDKKKEKTI